MGNIPMICPFCVFRALVRHLTPRFTPLTVSAQPEEQS